jgi:hypothetical protein
MTLSHHVLIALAGVTLSAGVAHAESIRHVPPAEAPPDAALELTADVARAWESTLTLHYRAIGAGAWTDVVFERAGDAASDTAWRAVVPAAAVAPPGVEYYIDSRAATDATTAPAAEFASAARPHQVTVMRTRLDERKDRELARVGNRRYRIVATAEYIDYGAREIGTLGTFDDRYYRTDVGFSYRLLAYPIERIHIGYTRLLGDVPATERSSPDSCDEIEGVVDRCRLRVGYKVGGWFGVRLGMGQGVDVDVRGMVMATNEGVGGGASAELRVGDEDGSHVALGFEAISAVGSAGRFRLGWATVPGLPMAATVEVTNLPSTVRATGIRVLYDVAHPISPGVRVGARVGYTARDAHVGGISGGANLTLEF